MGHVSDIEDAEGHESEGQVDQDQVLIVVEHKLDVAILKGESGYQDRLTSPALSRRRFRQVGRSGACTFRSG